MNPSTPVQINLLAHTDNANPKGRKIFRLSKFMLYVGVVLMLTFAMFSYEVLFTDNSLSNALGGFSLFHQLQTLASGEKVLAGQNEDRINILLLGIGGEGHDGPYLTDTMIVASIQPSTNKVAMMSIPRDLLVDIPGRGPWKINSANAFGETNNPGNGGDLASQVVSQTFGVPIHYYVRIDFNGFEKLIDDLGGVKIQVDRAFTDSQFPTLDEKYQVVSFDAGWQTMDGATALNYVRSRHGNNGEGSDFARSKRQQKVLQSFKERVLSYNTLLNPAKLGKLINAFGEHVKTNMELADISNFIDMSKSLDTQHMITQVLDDSPTGYVYTTRLGENGASVVKPKNDDYSTLQFLAKNIFASQQVITNKPTANLEIKNGTKIAGLAGTNETKMRTLGFKVIKVGNARTQDYQSTVVYRLDDKNDESVETILKSQYKTSIETDVPDWVKEDADLSTKYYIILGADAG